MSSVTTVEVHAGITSLAQRYQGVLLDAYGVFWGGNAVGLFPGAKEAMHSLVARGKVVGILTNSTQLADKEITKLKAHGLDQGTHFHFLVSSGEVARHIFLHESLEFPTPNKKYWVFCGDHPTITAHKYIFRDTCYEETTTIDEADFVYINVPHIGGQDQEDPEVFRAQVQALAEKGLPAVCANPDEFAIEGNPPRPVVRQGTIAKMYEESGYPVYCIGKPASKVYNYAMSHFRQHLVVNPWEVLMVGDTPTTDILGARRVNMYSALVIKTGIMAERVIRLGLESALDKLPGGATPHHLIERLADDMEDNRPRRDSNARPVA